MDLFKRKNKTVFDDQGRPLPNGWTAKATSKSLFKFSTEPFTNEEQTKEYIEETYAEVLTSLPKYQREHYTKEVHLKFLKHRDVDSFENTEENLYQQGVKAVKDLNTAGAIPSEIVENPLTASAGVNATLEVIATTVSFNSDCSTDLAVPPVSVIVDATAPVVPDPDEAIGPTSIHDVPVYTYIC